MPSFHFVAARLSRAILFNYFNFIVSGEKYKMKCKTGHF